MEKHTIRVGILKALNEVYPLCGLSSTALKNRVSLSLDCKAEDIEGELKPLWANDFIAVQCDPLSATKVIYSITPCGVEYLEERGLA